MRRYLKYCILPALAALVAACGAGTGSSDDGRLSVVTTIYPLGYMAGRVGGDDVDVQSLIGPGSEAHAFEPTSSDVQRLSEARLVVANGLDLEPSLGRVLAGLSEDARPVMVEASDIDGLEPSEAEQGEGGEDLEGEDGHDHETDPHVWLDPVLAQRQVERIRDAMMEVDAGNAEAYTARAQTLMDDLAALHDEYVAGLSDCAHEHFVTTHSAYGYVAERYGLEQIAIAGVSPEAEPTPRALADLTERVSTLGLQHVLAEPSLSSRLAETVAAESGLQLLPIHQMESVTEQELADHGDYLGLMRANLASLKTALGCEE